MDPNSKPSFGSGSPMVGGPFVASQMGAGAPGAGQQGPSSPGFVPNTQQNPLPGTMPQGSPMSLIPPNMGQPPQTPTPPPMGVQGAPGTAQMAKEPPTPIKHKIIEALIKQIAHLSEIEKRLVDHHLPESKDGQSATS